MNCSSSTDDRTNEAERSDVVQTPQRGIRVNFAPHINTIIETGKSHFSRPVDAIAEYIDNSIQACKDTPQPEIRICVFLATRANSASFFLILDNGSGMNVQTIQEFATYSLDKKTRGLAPDRGDKTFIGKFGVGAKEAGFYLGDRIKLFTKHPEERSVLSFYLDAKELLQKYENHEDAYSGEVREVDLERSMELKADEQSFPDIERILQDHFSTVPKGSAFLVKLRDDMIVPLLRKMDNDELQQQIMDIYHFHLHPEHCPGNIERTLRRRDNQESFAHVGSNLNITYELYYPNLRDEKCNLRDESDFFHQCVNNTGNIFPFRIEAPLPGSEVNSQKYSIHGFFLYFPFKDGKETIPTKDGKSVQHDIQIYWQNRLVPHENRLKELHFLPAKTDAVGSNIARNWRDRIIGFLFFGWEFDRIANNKLRFLNDPHDWFNTKVYTSQILTFPTDAKSKFKGWLVNCHKADREFIFADRNRSLDKLKRTFFESLTFGHYKVQIKKGDRIKIKPSNKNESVVYGEVVAFVVNETISHYENQYFGPGNVRYVGLPKQLFFWKEKTQDKTKEETKEETKEDEKSITEIDPRDVFATEKELAELENAVPKRMDVFLFEQGSNKRKLMNNCTTEFLKGVTYNRIGIQIKNTNGELVFQMPDAKKQRFSVRVEGLSQRSLKVANLQNVNTGRDIGPELPLERANDCFYCVKDITFSLPGPTSFFVYVYSPYLNNPLFCQEIQCNVVSMPAERFEIVPKIGTALCVQLGQPFPSFHVRFLDRMGQCVPPPNEDIKLEMKSDLVDVLPRDRFKGPQHMTTSNNEEVLLYKEGDWKVSPKRRASLFSKESVEAVKEVKIQLSLSTRNIGSRFDSFSSPVELKVKLSPGPPAKIAVLQPALQSLVVDRGAVVDALHLAVTDEWGHRVAPKQGERWLLRLGEGPLQLPHGDQVGFSANGDLSLNNLQCKNDVDDRFNKQSLELICNDGKSETVVEGAELTIEVRGLINPTSIRIRQQINGEEFELEDCLTCKAGDTLSNLTVVVYNESGDEIDDEILPNMKIDYSWPRPPKKRASDFLGLTLPDIQISKSISDSPFMPSVTVSFGRRTLQTTLDITIKPAEPVKWSLLSSSDLDRLGLDVDEIDDLEKKICGAVWTDEFGNRPPYDKHPSDESAELCPFLQIYVPDEDAMELEIEDALKGFKPFFPIPLRLGKVQIPTEKAHSSTSSTKKRGRNVVNAPQQFDEEFEGFVPPSGVSLEKLRDYHQKKILIRVEDGSQQLSPSEPKYCSIVKSLLPKHVFLSCQSLGVAQPASEISVNVPSFSSISDLSIHMLDADGHPANLREVSSVKIEVFDSKKRKVFSAQKINSSVMNAKLSYDFSSFENDEALDRDRVVKFECVVSYQRGRKAFTLPPAHLLCTVQRLKNVVDLKIKTQDYKYAEMLQREGNVYSMAVVCGGTTPSLLLALVTDNGIPLVPDRDMFVRSTAKRITESGETIVDFEFNDLFQCKSDKENRCLILKPEGKLANQQEVCVFEFKIEYEEKDSDLISILPEEKKFRAIELRVNFVSGSLTKLYVSRTSLKTTQKGAVSNSIHPERRLIGANVCPRGNDQYGNIACFSDLHEVRCHIVESGQEPVVDFETDTALLPRLRGADEHGFIMTDAKNKFIFHRIELDYEQSDEWKDGEYFLCFSMWKKKTDSSPIMDEAVLPVLIAFRFISNETNAHRLNELSEEIELRKTRLEEYVKWEKDLKALKFQLLESRSKYSQINAENSLRDEDMSETYLCELQARREREISEMQHREAHKQINPLINEALKNNKVLGQMVDLGFVDDLNEAKVLSWACKEIIDAVIVKDTDTAKKLFEKNMKVLALDQLELFMREKNPSHKDLPPVAAIRAIPADRQPCYLVDLIRLNPEHENLRATLFSYAFSDSILFHTKEDAFAYHQHQTRNRVLPPTLYSRSGECIKSSGAMVPGPSLPLSFVFGEQRKKKKATEELNTLKKIIETVKKIDALNENKPDIVDIAQLSREINFLQEQCDNLLVEMGERRR